MKFKFSLSLLAGLLIAVAVMAQELPKARSLLSNQDVIDMVKSGLSAEIINAKIVSTDASFNTSPAALRELKEAGVPQEVILVLVKNPLGMTSATPKPALSAAFGEPEYGTIQDIKGLSKVFVRADDDDARSTIIGMLHGYEGLQVVESPRDAEIILDYGNLTRDVAANYGRGAMGASMALKSQMRASITKADGTKLIAWTETETFDVTNGLTFNAPNEVNLTHHFVREIQKARGEKSYSMRKLYQSAQKYKKEEKKKN
jgi:hypothetical protein